MTTSAGLPAVRDSLHLALLADPSGSPTVVELADAAVEFYDLGYSRHPPHLLFAEVHEARRLLARALTNGSPSGRIETDLRRGVGRLSALLGNLAFHLGDAPGARAHLATAITYGDRVGDARLAAWACGAQAMVARAVGQHTAALDHADRGLTYAPAGLPRAQLYAWARLLTLAKLHREREADAALADASRELEGDAQGWAAGRFGYDASEHTLHEAEAHRALGRTERALTCAERSLAEAPVGTPGWVAASLLTAQIEAVTAPADAAQRASAVLDRVPASRLRSTSRSRVRDLAAVLRGVEAAGVGDLRERVRALAPSIDATGAATSA
ncbi:MULTISPECIES: Twin-arginine translocation pathway signal [unclassified Streptomyces]|uniref:Twin-arginine translocation pathway signal n=1 Tax=Streptomyces sp. NPDC055082 TaxID=3365718 RepID=UPI0037D939BE